MLLYNRRYFKVVENLKISLSKLNFAKPQCLHGISWKSLDIIILLPSISTHYRCDLESWAKHKKFNNETKAFDVYISSIYWAAATMTSTGYGDITARSTRGEFIVLFVLIIGLLMYGFCLSTITAILTTKLSAK